MAWTSLEQRRAYFRKRYQKVVRFLRRYKVEKGCFKCGYNKHHAALEFDHLPRFASTKRKVATLAGRGIESVKKGNQEMPGSMP